MAFRVLVLANVLVAGGWSFAQDRDDEPAAASSSESSDQRQLDLLGEARRLQSSGEVEAAAERVRELLRLSRETPQARGAKRVELLHWYADLCQQAQRFDELIGAREELLRVLVAEHGADHWQAMDARLALERSRRLPNFSEAERAALAQAEEHRRAALAAETANDHANAAEQWLMAARGLRDVWGKDDVQVGDALLRMCAAMRKGPHAQKATGPLGEAVAIFRDQLGEQHPRFAEAVHLGGTIFLRQKDYERAAGALMKALEVRRETLGTEHDDTRETFTALHQAMRGLEGEYAARLRELQRNRTDPPGDELVEALKRKLQIDSFLYSKYPARIAGLADSLARAHKQREEFVEAQRTYLLVAELRARQFGDASDYRVVDVRSEAAHMESLAALNAEQRARLKGSDDLEQRAQALRRENDSAEALPLQLQALAVRLELLGKDSRVTAGSANLLGLLLDDLGQAQQAVQQYELALDIHRRVTGEDHPVTTTTMANLALVLVDEPNSYAEGIKLLEKALAANIKVYGENHRRVNSTRRNLGISLLNGGEPAKAKQHLEHVVEQLRRWRVGGAELARSLNDLAGTYRGLQDYAAARPLHEEALQIYLDAHGEEHNATAGVMNDLALALNELGETKAAQRYYERSLSIRTKLLGAAHPDTASVATNLGLLLVEKLHDYQAGLPLLKQALDARTAAHDIDHPESVRCQRNYGVSLNRADRGREARPHLEAVFNWHERRGVEDAELARSLNDLGELVSELGDHADAERHLQRSLRIYTAVRGERHADTVLAMANLATTYNLQGRYLEARRLLEQALHIATDIEGAGALLTSQVLANLGSVLVSAGDFTAAQPYLEQAVDNWRSLVGEEDPRTAHVLSELGKLSMQQSRYTEARRQVERALGIYEATIGVKNRSALDTLMTLGHLSLLQSRFDEASQHLEQALKIAQEVHGARQYEMGNLLNKIGWFLSQVGTDYDAARKKLELALEILAESLGEQHPASLDALGNLAGVLVIQGEHTQARALYERGLEHLAERDQAESPDAAPLLLGLGRVIVDQGDYRSAVASYETAVAVLSSKLGADHHRTLKATISLAQIRSRLGDRATARDLCEDALARLRRQLGEDHADVALALGNVGETMMEQGDYIAARRYLENALAIRQRLWGARHPDTAHSLESLGVLSFQLGDFERGRQFNEQVLAIRQESFGENNPLTAVAHNNLGRTLLDLGEYELAEEHLRRSLETYHELFEGPHHETSVVLDNLAWVMLAQQRYEEARQYGEQALDMTEAVWGREHHHLARAHNNLAVALTMLGDREAALEHARASHETETKASGIDHPHTLSTANNVGTLLIQMSRFDEARQILQDATQRQLDQLYTVIDSLAEAEVLARVRQFYTSSDSLLSLLRLMPDTSAEEAYQLVWATRGLATRAMTRRRIPVDANEETRRVWQELSAARSRLARAVLAEAAAGDDTQRRRLINDLTDEKERLERKLADASADFLRQRRLATLVPADIASQLRPNEAIVHFVHSQVNIPASHAATDQQVLGEYHYDAFVVRRCEPQPGYEVKWVRLGPAMPIEFGVTLWRQRMLLGASDDQQSPEQWLRRTVWEPIEAELSGCDTVILVPDGALSAIPWAALPGREVGSYLVEDYGLATASHPEHLFALLTDEQPARSLHLVVGGVDYERAADDPQPLGPPHESTGGEARVAQRGPALDDGERPKWSFLSGARDEARQVAALFSEDEMNLIEGAAATERALRASLPKVRLAHLATHGFFADPRVRSALETPEQVAREIFSVRYAQKTPVGRNPLTLSGIVLAGANRPVEADEHGIPIGDDGVLTGEEVAQLDLSGCDLVVLSACETGLGQVAGREGVFGLQRAFAVAGAKTVVASLWKVHDGATKQLMSRFYGNLQGGQMSRLEALREAQLWMLRDAAPLSAEGKIRGIEELPDEHPPSNGRLPPYYWAAFTLSGQWR